MVFTKDTKISIIFWYSIIRFSKRFVRNTQKGAIKLEFWNSSDPSLGLLQYLLTNNSEKHHEVHHCEGLIS